MPGNNNVSTSLVHRDPRCIAKSLCDRGTTHHLTDDRDGNVQDEDIGDDHDQDPAYLPPISDDQVKTRVEHERLTGHHGPPTNSDDDAGDLSILPYLEVQHQE